MGVWIFHMVVRISAKLGFQINLIDSCAILVDMAPRLKKQTGKHPRKPSPEPEHIEFAIPDH